MPGNQIEIGIGLKDQLSAGLKRATSNLTNFTNKVKRGFSAVTNAVFSVKGAIIGLASGYVIRRLLGVLDSVTSLDDAFQKLSIQTGVSTEALSALKFAGEQSGLSWAELAKAIESANRRLGEFRSKGTGPAADGLKVLGGGIAAAVRDGASFEDVLFDMADGFNRLTSESEKAYVSYNIFGRSGIKVGTQLLHQGSEALKGYINRAKELGIVISQDAANKAAKWKDSVNELSKAWEGFEQTVVIGILPELTTAVQELTEWFVDHKNDIKLFFDAIKDGAKEAGKEFSKIGILFNPRVFTDPNYFEKVLGEYIKNYIRDRIPGGIGGAGGTTPVGTITLPDIDVTASRIRTGPAVPPGPTTVLGQPGRVQQFWADYADSVSSANVAVRTLDTSLGGIEQVMAGLASRTLTWKQAWQQFSQQMLADLARITTRLLLVSAVQGLGGLFGFGAAGSAAAASAAGAASSAGASGASALATSSLSGLSFQHGGSLLARGPSSGYLQPLLLHGSERVDITPMGKSGGGATNIQITTNIHATDAESFDRRWSQTYGKYQKEIAETVAGQIRRRPTISRTLAR